ncbi:MAG TPA: MarR family winged helix-turn-helix transcriptional regulator [Dehalococcoidales bacterium]|nr:MarR family winged helix-turn-helix transcriptional regulator [Dehalococcoidales bacterium]
MPAKFTFASYWMKSWLLIHQSHNLLERIENNVFAEVGLTARKHSILLAIKNLKSPVLVKDVAHWLDRSPNSISMIVDSMEKEGLIRRLRDVPDRREVRLTMTDKGADMFKSANNLTSSLLHSIFGEVPEEDLKKLAATLEKIRFTALDFLDLDLSHEELHVIQHEKTKNGEYAKG